VLSVFSRTNRRRVVDKRITGTETDCGRTCAGKVPESKRRVLILHEDISCSVLVCEQFSRVCLIDVVADWIISSMQKLADAFFRGSLLSVSSASKEAHS